MLNVKSMQISIVRGDHKPWGVDGHLYINRKRVCDTVEHPTRHRAQGEYEIDLENNPFRHGDGALCCRRGEIIVGKQLVPGVVTQSQLTYDRLYERLKKAWQRGRTVKLSLYG